MSHRGGQNHVSVTSSWSARVCWNRHGVTIQAEGGGYLHADHGAITIAAKPTTFELS